MLRVKVYLKCGSVAEFEAEGIEEGAAEHPKFALEFTPPTGGGRRLVYLDRDDVSAVVTEDVTSPEASAAVAAAEALIETPAPLAAHVLASPELIGIKSGA
jgi:hypothetical protein